MNTKYRVKTAKKQAYKNTQYKREKAGKPRIDKYKCMPLSEVKTNTVKHCPGNEMSFITFQLCRQPTSSQTIVLVMLLLAK